MFLRAIRTLTAAGALLLCGAAAPAQQSVQAPSAEDFGALPFLLSPRLSPDGSRIAARGIAKGETFVMIVDLARGEKKLTPFTLPEKHKLEWFRWAGDHRIIVSLSRMEGIYGEDYRLTRLVMIDLASGKQSFIGPREQGMEGDNVIHVDPAGNFLLLSTQGTLWEYPSVYRVDLETGKSSRIVRPHDRVWSWYADRAGVVRAGAGINGGKSWILYRQRESDEFERTVTRKAGQEIEADYDALIPIVGTDKGYAIADRDGRFALFRYDFREDALGELVYENPKVDVEDLTLSPTGEVLGISYTDDRPEIAWFDPDLKKLQDRIDRALPGAVNRVVSMSDDNNRLLVHSASSTEPGTFLVYDRSKNVMSVFAEAYARIAGKRLAPMEPVRYKARDGLEIRAYLTLPPGSEDAKGLPLVIMPHGGPYSRDSWGYDNWTQYLASRGYAVLQPNFRGSTGFGRAFVEKGTGQWGRGMQDDVDDGVKWLAASGRVDARRVCIMGGSYGGYAAMWAAVRNPEMYRCAISFAGVSDVNAQLKYSRKSFSAPRYFSDWRDRVRGDKDFELSEISPLKQVERLSVPILIAHGTEDDTVPLYQSRRLHDALLKLKRDHEYVVYDGEGHGFEKAENATDFLNRVGAFLDKYNPAGRPATP